MRKFITAMVLALICTITSAQCNYDSTRNFLGDHNVESYIGQVLYLKPQPRALQGEGYDNFYTSDFSATSDQYDRRYILCPYGDMYNFRSSYDSLVHTKFVVIDVEPYTAEYNSFWPQYLFTLEDINQPGQICKYLYNAKCEWTFPFVTLSHYYFLMNTFYGQEIVCWNNINNINLIDSSIIPPSEEPFRYWNCIDVDIDDESGQLSLFLQSLDSSIITSCSTNNLLNFVNQRKFLIDDWIDLVNTYSLDAMTNVMNGTISNGTPKYLLYMAWGIPDRILKHPQQPDTYVYGNTFVDVYNDTVTNIHH